MKIVNPFRFWTIGLMRFSLIVVGLLWFGVFLVRATDRYVVPPGSAGITSGIPYNAWTNAATNIQSAVDVAALDEKVWVTNGAYRITNQITLTNRIILQSVNGYSNTLVYANWPAYTNVRCFYVSGTGVVDGFTISNGHLTGSIDDMGGAGAYVTTNGMIQNCFFTHNVNSNTGVSANGGGLHLRGGGIASNCLFVSNTAYSKPGGGIFVDGGGQVLKCTLTSNYTSSLGGGIYAQDDTTIISNCVCNYNSSTDRGGGVAIFKAILIDSVISNNRVTSTGQGGGVYMYLGTVRNCTIIDNFAGFAGGGIWINGASYASWNLVSNCVIAGNSTPGGGGGIYQQKPYNDDHKVVACLISNNMSSGGWGKGGGGLCYELGGQVLNCLICNNTNTGSSYGGGVFLSNAALMTNTSFGLINCTIVNNYSINEGGGIAAAGLSNYIVNCVIASNRSSLGNYPNVYHSDNPSVNKSNYYYSCSITTDAYLFAANQGNITNDPVFADAAGGNWRLLSRSPCVNTGTNQNWMTNSFDLDGRIRIRYGVVDMGAYETIYEGTVYRFP